MKGTHISQRSPNPQKSIDTDNGVNKTQDSKPLSRQEILSKIKSTPTVKVIKRLDKYGQAGEVEHLQPSPSQKTEFSYNNAQSSNYCISCLPHSPSSSKTEQLEQSKKDDVKKDPPMTPQQLKELKAKMSDFFRKELVDRQIESLYELDNRQAEELLLIKKLIENFLNSKEISNSFEKELKS